MAEVPRDERITADGVIDRTPVLLQYLANVMKAAEESDEGRMVEIPAELPLDEATLVAFVFLALTFADEAGYDSAAMQALADVVTNPTNAAAVTDVVDTL